jgi:uncharacterized protein (DUF2235 family)
VSKNIVICCDGTGNSTRGVPSNVKRLHRLLLEDAGQVTTYHEGVGTALRLDTQSRFTYWPRHVAELGFGVGIDETLATLYAWLVETYEDGDRLCFFGFSRGAFTVRALAGMIHVFGLLHRGERVAAKEVVRRYRGSERRIKQERHRRGLGDTFGPCEIDHAAMDSEALEFAARHGRPCTVDFLGLWDTVKSYGWVWPRSFPALRHNMSVRTVRHAVSLDERRSLFQITGWASAHIDVKEVWFAGDHSDVGGGHASGNSPLADASLRWMLGEAVAAGLRFDLKKARREAPSSADAAHEPAKGRRERWKFFLPGCLPRFELDNHAYPPDRDLRILWPLAARKPGDHAFGSTVWIHQSVEERRLAGERRYRTTRLVRRSWSLARRSSLDAKPVGDLPLEPISRASTSSDVPGGHRESSRSPSATIITP